MTTFSDDLVRSLGEALEHAKGKGPAIVHPAVSPRAVREALHLTQTQMAPLVGMSPSGLSKVGTGHSPRQRPCCRIA